MSLSQFESLVSSTLHFDPSIRQPAEAQLTNLRQNDPKTFMMALMACLTESKIQEVREFAAVILRQSLLVTSTQSVWKNCPKEVQQRIQAGLLFLFQNEPSPTLRRKITDAIAATATRMSGHIPIDFSTDENGISRSRQVAQTATEEQTAWPELMTTVLTLAQQNAPQTRESLCNLIDKSANTKCESMR